MGLRADIREELRKETTTKIYGQPTDHDATPLEKELIAIAATIPTTLRGGNHGHAGIIVEPTKYLTMTGGIAFAGQESTQQDLHSMQQREQGQERKHCTQNSLPNMKSIKE